VTPSVANHAARTLVRADHPRALDLANSSIVEGQQAHEDAALNTWPAAAEGNHPKIPEAVAPQGPAGSIAEPDHEPIQVIALRDRVPAHSGRAGRHHIMGQEPVQEDVGLQDGEWPARAPVVAVAEAQ
jgi:hypothetical protein